MSEVQQEGAGKESATRASPTSLVYAVSKKRAVEGAEENSARRGVYSGKSSDGEELFTQHVGGEKLRARLLAAGGPQSVSNLADGTASVISPIRNGEGAEDGSSVGSIVCQMGVMEAPIRFSLEATSVQRMGLINAEMEAGKEQSPMPESRISASSEEETKIGEARQLDTYEGASEEAVWSIEGLAVECDDEEMEGETEWTAESGAVLLAGMVSRTETKADGPRKRGSRKSAVRASALTAGHLASKAPAKRKRLVRHVESSDESEEKEEPFDELCEIERLVKREDREGKRWYLVKWLVDTPDGKSTWLPEEALGGAAEWKKAVDRYYDEALPKDPSLTIQQWLRRYVTVITMGDNASATCVYEAVRVVLRLQGTPFELTEELIHQFEEKEAMCQGGLRTDTVQKLFEFLIRKRKWQVELKPNVYGKAGQLTGPAGILMAVNLKPGVYVVATLDSLYRGRYIVVKVGHDKMAFAYEDGLKMGLGEYLYAKTICWIRECVDTVGDGVRILDEGGPGEIAPKLVKAPLARRQAKPRRRKRPRNASRTGLVEVADETG